MSLANVALRKIGQIRKFLNRETAEKLVHAFVSSRLDSCNGILYGLPESELRKLQQVQNSAARMHFALVKKATSHHTGIAGAALVTSKEANNIQDLVAYLQGIARTCSALYSRTVTGVSTIACT